jgi:predicted RNA binding protein YcfA (HicA-like mRNA interferase family)
LKRSTGETDRKAAKDIAHSYELAAQKLKTSRQVRRVISDLHRAITGEALTSQTFRGYSKLWLAHKKPLLKSSSYGWFLVRTRGSHRQYKHAQKPGLVTIAGKPSDDLAPGTKNSILKQAGLK